MDLKCYQRRVVDDVERYLAAVAEQRASGNVRFAAMAAWEDLNKGQYYTRKNGLGEDLPTFCIKVPTGGGKTLLATQALGSIYRTILKGRNGAGLVLWVAPSSQIYRDTLRRLRDRHDLYRLMLEHAVSRRIEVWEKHEIARLSAARLRDCLNILVVQLASTNRETKDQLKFFQDSGGNIVQHFPAEDDYAAHKAVKDATPNLDMLEKDEASGRYLAKTSIGNLVKLARPPVILDEGHKATSDLARKTIEEFNASVVVELSATPRKGTNIVSRVSGQELLDEEMIKLPLNIATSGQKSWKDVLTQARDKRELLARKAAELAKSEQFIRPIILVQVERTGKDQREAKFVHALDVKEHLMQRLNVIESAIAIKSAETDDIEGIDLLDPGCPIEWIITKSALQEGWDCPFAYILVSLTNTGSGQSMTQLVGRILRQPYQQRTTCDDLNESYVFCLYQKASEVAADVKKALEREGYEGDLAGTIVDASAREERPKRTVNIRPQYLQFYRRPFEGKIYLPHFCVRDGDDYEALDYFQHLVTAVDVKKFRYGTINWPLAESLREAKNRYYRVTLGEQMTTEREGELDRWETDDRVMAWLSASLKFEFLSRKQLQIVVRRVCEHLRRAEFSVAVNDHLALVKFVVRDKIESFVQGEVDFQTQKAFVGLHKAGRLCFYLKCADCRFQVPESIQIRSTQPLTHNNGDRVAKSLFDYVERESANEYERAVALCLDRDEKVLWWYRNLVGHEHFAVQGFRRHRIRPDFVVQKGTMEKPEHCVVVVESKGEHLAGSSDTEYKREVARYFSDVGRKVPWQQLGNDFHEHVFRFQVLDEAQDFGRDWSDELRDMLASPC